MTFQNVTGKDRLSVCRDFEVDVEQAEKDFHVVGEAFNFEPHVLKRKIWNISTSSGTVIRKDFGGLRDADESVA